MVASLKRVRVLLPAFVVAAGTSAGKHQPETCSRSRAGTVMKVSRRSADADPAIIEQLHLDFLKPGVLSLAAGVSYKQPPRESIEHGIAQLTSPKDILSRYGEVVGEEDLLDQVRTKLSVENAIEGKEVMITAGANQAFVNSVLATCDPGDEVILIKPYYFSHLVALQLCNVKPVLVDCDTHFLPIPKLIKSALTTKTRALVLVNPGNPSGQVVDKALVEELERICEQENLWLISDEAYEHFIFSGDSVHYSPKMVPQNVINLYTMSKSYALAGYRVGYAVFPQTLSESMLKINDTIPTHACRLSQTIAASALKSCSRFPADHASELLPGRDELWKAVEQFCQIQTKGAFYFFVPLPKAVDDMYAVAVLAQEFQVLVVPGVSFGMKGYIRVSYAGLPLENLKVAAKRLEMGLRRLYSAGANEK